MLKCSKNIFLTSERYQNSVLDEERLEVRRIKVVAEGVGDPDKAAWRHKNLFEIRY